MTSITDLGSAAWRDWVTDGVPSSGARRVPKSEARAVMAAIDTQKAETVADLTALKALTTRPESVLVKSGQAAGVWQWVAGSATTVDDALVVTPTSGAAGRYKRIVEGRYAIKWWGAVADGTTNDRPAFAAADAALVSIGGGELHIPKGAYKLSSDFSFSDKVSVHIDAGTTIVTSVLRGALLEWDDYSPTTTAGAIVKAGRILTRNEDVTHDLKSLGGIWAEPVTWFTGVAVGFLPADESVPDAGLVAFGIHMSTKNTAANAVSFMPVATVAASNCRVFASNPIVRSVGGGLTGIGLLNEEVDLLPTVGDTPDPAKSGVRFTNVFNVGDCGYLDFISGVGSGTLTGGILFNSGIKSSGTLIADAAGISCTYGIFVGNGTYSSAALAVKGGANLRMLGNGASVAADMSGDSSNNLNTILGGTFGIQAPNSTEGTAIIYQKAANGTAAVVSYVATGAAANAAATALYVGTNSSTSRSINAGGTVNAAGADYAEYERRRDDCGVVAKGQIIGLDADGLLTDRFSLAIAFGVKSTNPNLVGGDTWHEEAGPAPTPPVPPMEPGDAPMRARAHAVTGQRGVPDNADLQVREAILRHNEEAPKIAAAVEDDHASRMAAWQAEVDAYEIAMPIYRRDLEAYKKAHTEWSSRYEAARQKVDRIAYCGKCPVNVWGASPGDYIKAAKGDGDVIVGVVAAGKNDDGIVGRVRRVLSDGRAEILVMMS